MTSPTAPDGARSRRGTAFVVLLVLAVAVAGTVAFLGHRARATQEARTVGAAETALAEAADALRAAVVAGEQALGSSAGQVEDEQVRTDLADALAGAAALETGPADEGSGPERERTAEARRDAATAQRAVLEDATGAVADAFAAWTLAQAVADDDVARTALSTALADGAAALATGAGDDGARTALSDALAAATAVRDAPVDRADVDAVLASSAAVEAARDALGAATRAVTG